MFILVLSVWQKDNYRLRIYPIDKKKLLTQKKKASLINSCSKTDLVEVWLVIPD